MTNVGTGTSDDQGTGGSGHSKERVKKSLSKRGGGKKRRVRKRKEERHSSPVDLGKRRVSPAKKKGQDCSSGCPT